MATTADITSTVRDLLLFEASEILDDAPDYLQSARTTRTAADYAAWQADEAATYDRQLGALLDYEDRKLAVARRLFATYAAYAAGELRGLVRSLPTMTSIVAECRATYLVKHGHARPTPSARALVNTFAEPAELERARLRTWAARQLKRAGRTESAAADLVRVYVYLLLRDVCEWDNAHVEEYASDVLLNCTTASFPDAR